MHKSLSYLYFIIGAIEVYGEATDNDAVRFFSKPLLMIILIFYYVSSVQGPVHKFHKLMIAAFFFSWIGDVALMFVPRNTGDLILMGIPKAPNFFLVGLVGFLITHVLYCFAFARVSHRNVPALLKRKVWIVVPLALYMAALLSMLIPGILSTAETKPFLVPVIVYSSVIAAMVVYALNRYQRVNDASFALVFGGALLFMFSDSLIAISKFMAPFQFAGVLIMVLYITAQYLIAKGSLKQVHNI